MIKYKIKRKIVNCEKMESVTSHDLYPPSPLSQTVTLSQTPSPPLERDILYGRPLFRVNSVGAMYTAGIRRSLSRAHRRILLSNNYFCTISIY